MENLEFAIKYLLKNRRGNLARVISLTLGLSLGLLLLSYVNYRFHFDNFIPDRERIYKLFSEVHNDQFDGVDEHSHAPLATVLMADCPEVESTARAYGPFEYNWKNDEHEYALRGYLVDSMFMKVLDYGVICGNIADLSEKADAVFISEEKAKLIFGISNPIGQTIRDNMGNECTVAGVFNDIPYNTSLGRFDVLKAFISTNNLGALKSWDGTNEYLTFVKLHKGSSVKKVEDWINGPMLDKYGLRYVFEKYGAKYIMVPLTRAEIMVGTRKQYMDFFSILAALVLALCALNYSLLSISSLVKRSKTIAVLKCTAADRKDIWSQFMWETFIVLLVALALSALLLFTFKNGISNAVEGSISDLFAIKNIWVSIIVVIGFFLAAGLIPAAIFAAVPTSVAFRGMSDGKKRWKQALLIFELICVSFASAFLLTCIRQIDLMQNGTLGYNPKNTFFVQMLVPGGDGIFNAEQDLASLPFVESVGTSYSLPIFGYNPGLPCIDERTNEALFPICEDYVSDSYFDMMQIRLVEGTLLSEKNSSDDVVVNQKFLAMRGWTENPLDRIILLGNAEGQVTRRLRIVGVVEDVRTLYQGKLQPIIYHSIREKHSNDEWYYGGCKTMIRISDFSQENIDKLMDKLHNYNSCDNYQLTSYEECFKDKMKGELHFRSILYIVFLITMIIAIIGLSGYVSDDLRRRKKEIAIRKVSGATMKEIVTMVMKNVLLLTIPAIIVGEGIAAIATRMWLNGFEFRVGLSPWVFIVTALAVLALTFIIEIILTYRLANENPAISLKTE